MGELLTLDAAAALLTLTVLELVLGVDNVVLIAIVTDRLDRRRQRLARRLGLLAAMVMRIALLLGAAWLMGLTSPLLTLLGREVSAKDLVLLAGGAFLIFKATQELHSMLEGPSREEKAPRAASVGLAVAQIALFDVVFSIDSVLTAVGMTRHVPIMVVAIVLAVLAMLFFAELLAAFIKAHPTTKALALAFMLLVGVLLVADGLGRHVPRGYVYFALGFSVFVEAVNIRVRAVRARRAESAV